MAYDKAKLYAKALQLANDKENRLIWIEEVVAYLGISISTFYSHFPVDSKELEEIKEAIQLNKIEEKIDIRKKMQDSGNPTLLLAKYRLLSTPEEHRLLNNTTADTRDIDKDKENAKEIIWKPKNA